MLLNKLDGWHMVV